VLNWKLIKPYLGEYEKATKDRAYEIADIQNLLKKADERMKTAILLLASSGIRIGALVELQFRHSKAFFTIRRTGRQCPECRDSLLTAEIIVKVNGGKSRYFHLRCAASANFFLARIPIGF